MALRRGLRAAWAARPPVYGRLTWALVLALDRLPWPWGEEILSRYLVVSGLVRGGRLRRAFAWSRAHRSTARRRLRLALSLCSHHGRFVARSAFTGIPDLQTLCRLVSLRGAEHVVPGSHGAIFLGFHLGPTRPDLALRIAGHRVTWIGARGVWIGSPHAAGAWPPEIHRLYEITGEQGAGATAAAPRGAPSRAGVLYRARQILLAGGNVLITADGPGTIAFEVPLPGGPARVRGGWLLLRQSTGAPVLPVLSHLEGHTQVVTIHPALPPLDPDPVRDLEVCRGALERLLADYVERYPEQCYMLAFADSTS